MYFLRVLEQSGMQPTLLMIWTRVMKAIFYHSTCISIVQVYKWLPLKFVPNQSQNNILNSKTLVQVKKNDKSKLKRNIFKPYFSDGKIRKVLVNGPRWMEKVQQIDCWTWVFYTFHEKSSDCSPEIYGTCLMHKWDMFWFGMRITKINSCNVRERSMVLFFYLFIVYVFVSDILWILIEGLILMACQSV